MKSIVVADTFLSLQGTGALQGQEQFFIRFAGCSVFQCPIRSQCDEPAALDFVGKRYSVAELTDMALQAVGPGGWVHITGGEPLHQPIGLQNLVYECRLRGMKTQLQTSGVKALNTSGAKAITHHIDWITVSPKFRAIDLQQRIGQELCLIDSGLSVDDLKQYWRVCNFSHWFIVPLSLPAIDYEHTLQLVRDANKAGMNWKMGMQAHKVWHCK